MVSAKHSTMWELAQSVNMKSFRSIGLSKDQYKWILVKYDMQRDTRLSNLNQKYWDSNNGICAPADIITKEQYQEKRVRIEWDIAWSIFDHVNQGNDKHKDIDLNCLDVNEAITITKQTICDIAKELKQKQAEYMGNLFAKLTSIDELEEFKKNNKAQEYSQILSIKCADDHFQTIDKFKQLRRNMILNLIEQEMNLEHYYFEQASTIMVKIDHKTLEENPAL